MKKITFTKVVASGNDFVVIDNSHRPQVACRKSQAAGRRSFAKKICDRKSGVGADGLLLLEKSRVADIKMRILNADGSEAQMCGNGARSVALYISHKSQVTGRRSKLQIETKAGVIEARVSDELVSIKLTDPEDYEPGVSIKINDRELKLSSINTGVPHAVIFVDGIEHIDVSNLGRQIRYYECFAPSGTNVDFVEVVAQDTIKVRTYERGVEDETLACGTGAAAAAAVYRLQSQVAPTVRSGQAGHQEQINVITQGEETLKVYFKKDNDAISDVWLEGKVKIVYKGEYYVK
jgi:diaminopimelate epimerase